MGKRWNDGRILTVSNVCLHAMYVLEDDMTECVHRERAAT